MADQLSRRTALGLGVAATAASLGIASPAAAAPAAAAPVSGAKRVKDAYAKEKKKAKGTWHTHIAAVNHAGALKTIVADDADHVTYGYSVQKIAVAAAVLETCDRNNIPLSTKYELPADLILGGTGIYFLHQVWGDQITIANFLTAMLLVSDNTAVRMCGLVVPALDINKILAEKGFVHTRVEPVANPKRFYLGTTTPRETHTLLWKLANKTLLKPASCDFMLSILRWQNGYHDGVRRNMSSAERSRVATKYGADFNTLGASRHEAGIMFGPDGAPKLTYAMFAEGLGQRDNYGATHPAVQAHAVLGRTMFDALPSLSAKPATAASATAARPVPRVDLTPFVPVNGG
ncbi:MAG TPA: serine hydrolase [Actinoplanes sp.]|nr:serine hydrolase [Actinoplanes sp.]